MTLTPSRLWKQMTAEQRLRAASALWRDDQATNDQMHAALLIAKQINFRPKTVAGLADDRKARYLAGMPDLPEDLAARMLIVYHVAEQRPMMSAFLDAVGIAHENGLIRGRCRRTGSREDRRGRRHDRPGSTRRTMSRFISTRSCGRIRRRGNGWTECPKSSRRIDADPRIRALGARRHRIRRASATRRASGRRPWPIRRRAPPGPGRRAGGSGSCWRATSPGAG